MAISLSPTQGPTGGGNTVTISGVSGTATAVKFGAKTITAPGFTQVGSTITLPAPAGGGVVSVAVVSSSGTSNSVSYYYVGAPYIGSFYPTSGQAAGSTTVTFSGVGLATTSGVTFGGTAATSFTVASDNTVTATTSGGTGNISIEVLTAGGFVAGMPFTYLPAPTVSAITPNSGTIGGGTDVTITGTGLGTAESVTIGGVAVTTFSVIDDTTLTATTAAFTGTPGAVDVVVTTAGGTSTGGTGLFTYTTP